jgi:cytochrome c553
MICLTGAGTHTLWGSKSQEGQAERMPWNAHRIWFAVLSAACLSAVARAQDSELESPLPARPSNLQVLPKDMPTSQIGRLMKQFRDDLGVTCRYCHAENAQTQRLEYASDDNPKKQIARVMIVMLNDINGKYLTQLGDRRYAVPTTCGSCHQGQSTPPPFESR